MAKPAETIEVRGANEHNLKNIDVSIDRGAITVITGVSGSGKSSLAFDTVLAESQRRFFYTLSHYSRQFLDLSARPAVRSLTGLSPAIALAQNETPPSRRATVGTLTDLSELLAVLFARFGIQHCPVHGLPTAALSVDAITDHITGQFAGETLAICAPVVTAKKGVFRSQLTAFAERGYLKAQIDGQIVALASAPALGKAEKHTIKLIVDYVKVRPEAAVRLRRSVETALSEGLGYVEIFRADAKGEFRSPLGTMLSTAGGCPRCAFSWPRLDSRHFSANSLGRCPSCQGLGYAAADGAAPAADDGASDDAGDDGEELGLRARTGLEDACPSCGGTGLDPQLKAISLTGQTPLSVQQLPLTDVLAWLEAVLAGHANPALRRVADEARAGARRVIDVGLGYLGLARRVRSLSGGEAQRLKLAGILVEDLRGVLYVLDEPSQGLHPTELERLVVALRRLQAAGNTVLIVDHDELLMRRADWIIDLGPGGGARGGQLMAKFRPAEAQRFVAQSVTARFLAADTATPKLGSRGAALPPGAPALVLQGASRHNLQIPAVRFPLAALTVVTGVSGAGKSSLVLQTLYPNAAALLAAGVGHAKPGPGKGAARRAGPATPAARASSVALRSCTGLSGVDTLASVALVDRRPIARSGVSMPVSYLDVLGELRDLYASQPDAQVMGLTARSFSLSVEGGRCPECKGRGELSLSMRFLADARVRCPLCKGCRFQAAVLAVRYQGLNLSEVLELTLDEALAHFQHHRKIVQRLTPAVELGLGYLKMGQPSASLSGGEAQRLKLVPHLGKRVAVAASLIVLDEPTAGLHFEDVGRLLAVLRRLVDAGATVVMVEHNADVIAAADWVIELGPGSAAAGGRLLREYSPAAGKGAGKASHPG